jgi:hypothetical protein
MRIEVPIVYFTVAVTVRSPLKDGSRVRRRGADVMPGLGDATEMIRSMAFLYLRNKRVVAKSELQLLAGEAFVVDVKRNRDLGILGGLLLLFDVDFEIAGGS